MIDGLTASIDCLRSPINSVAFDSLETLLNEPTIEIVPRRPNGFIGASDVDTYGNESNEFRLERSQIQSTSSQEK